MVIDQLLLDELSAQAKVSPRLSQAYDLRNTPEDNSQRMLNALEPGTVMPIHRHRGSSETVVVLRGANGTRSSASKAARWFSSLHAYM